MTVFSKVVFCHKKADLQIVRFFGLTFEVGSLFVVFGFTSQNVRHFEKL